jgi:hypothetical protein
MSRRAKEQESTGAARIHCVYFTCDKHFPALRLSLKSLVRLGLPFLGRIYLYVDKDDFLTPAHTDTLGKMGLDVVARKCNRVTGWGESAVGVETRAFAELSSEIGPDDYLAKLDSDVIFVADQTFRDVLKSGKDLFGQLVDYWEPAVFFQGGCYFIRGALLSEFKHFDMSVLPRTMAALSNETATARQRFLKDSCPDEAAIYFFLKDKTERIALADFMVSPYDMFTLTKPVTTIHYVRSRLKMNAFELFKATRIRGALMKTGVVGRQAVAVWRAFKAPFRRLRKAA